MPKNTKNHFLDAEVKIVVTKLRGEKYNLPHNFDLLIRYIQKNVCRRELIYLAQIVERMVKLGIVRIREDYRLEYLMQGEENNARGSLG